MSIVKETIQIKIDKVTKLTKLFSSNSYRIIKDAYIHEMLNDDLASLEHWIDQSEGRNTG